MDVLKDNLVADWKERVHWMKETREIIDVLSLHGATEGVKSQRGESMSARSATSS